MSCQTLHPGTTSKGIMMQATPPARLLYRVFSQSSCSGKKLPRFGAGITVPFLGSPNKTRLLEMRYFQGICREVHMMHCVWILGPYNVDLMIRDVECDAFHQSSDCRRNVRWCHPSQSKHHGRIRGQDTGFDPQSQLALVLGCSNSRPCQANDFIDAMISDMSLLSIKRCTSAWRD